MRAAKKVVGNPDVRRTWIFFGDPAMRLKGYRAFAGREHAARDAGAGAAGSGRGRVSRRSLRRVSPSRATRRRAARGLQRRRPRRHVARAAGNRLVAVDFGAPGSFQYTSGQFAVTGEPLALRLNNDNLDRPLRLQRARPASGCRR